MTISLSARAERMRQGRIAVLVAVATSLAVNAGLLAILSWLDVPVEIPPEAPPIVRHLSAPPPRPPTVAAVPSPTPTPAPPTTIATPSPALPPLELPSLAAGIALPLPRLPTLDLRHLTDVPTVIAAMPTGQPGMAGPVLDADGVVDEPPVLLNGFDLERFYPRQARLRGVEGTTILRLEIAADGSVAAAKVLSSTPPDTFEAGAEKLAKTLRFTPGRIGGAAVRCAITQSIAWRLPQ